MLRGVENKISSTLIFKVSMPTQIKCSLQLEFTAKADS